jgi:hypothetical protein
MYHREVFKIISFKIQIQKTYQASKNGKSGLKSSAVDPE